MRSSVTTLTKDLIAQLREGYRETFGSLNPHHLDTICWTAKTALENLATSNALYHDVEHTLLVTLTGQAILRGVVILEGDVSSKDWAQFIVALLCHDVGYVKGICRQDKVQDRRYATGISDEFVVLPHGLTDASLAPYHVDRGKRFVEEHFQRHDWINLAQVQQNIELTRFPVPAKQAYQRISNYPGLARAADLIGQLSDPYYLQKLPALFHEFEELGQNAALGYANPADMRWGYPQFYRAVVSPYIQAGLRYLEVTHQGRQIISQLYANVFVVEEELAAIERSCAPQSDPEVFFNTQWEMPSANSDSYYLGDWCDPDAPAVKPGMEFSGLLELGELASLDTSNVMDICGQTAILIAR